MKGVGVHTGADISLLIAPGERGIRFTRSDVGASVAADWQNVSATRLATVIEDGAASVRTVEHLMSAFAALGIVGAEVTLDGPEVPIMDGSATPFFEPLSKACESVGTSEAITVARPVVASRRDAFAALLPFDGQRFDVGIDFPEPVIGVQRIVFDLSAEVFGEAIAPARTFGRLADVKALRRRGYAKGASLDNAIAIDHDRVVNPGGLRFSDEFVRHKALDAVGDLALAGRPILGLYRSHKAGHALNHALLKQLLLEPQNTRLVPP